ncbi:RNA polymerase sigma factor [Opitutus terrae]|uniref:RNA polymerase, sigma-24 subunit, ECF subfamily n=1 Tax=Opitutus terrae (strain DSM 11246 / JCM 15787 / PB90-1) TaxID=452637 RepID=B1ZQY0_OPITP|nr:sigma-70 family RNA polymerase sigma factor [Opitutus terrae]ACB73647.1 RNA polymerase, sigma-24 subunit, ECF subfamily [Opitutus terrae PB90-1]
MNEESERSSDSLPTRLSLLGRLADLSDNRSWREFYLTYEAHIRGLARRRGLPEQDAEEVAHDVLRRVAETIRNYQPSDRRGAFRRWLFQLTRWRASDRLRQRRRDEPPVRISLDPPADEPGGGERAPFFVPAAPPQLDQQFETEAQRYALATLLSRLERTVSKKHLQIFQMVMLDDVPVPRVAELFRTQPAAVYVIKHRVLEKLRAEVAELGPVLELS